MRYLDDIWTEIVTWCHAGIEPEPEPVITNVIYGALYNWYAVNTGMLAVAGWNIPDYDEFLILYNYLTMDARPLKENNLAYWDSPLSATNTMNFNARGSGRRRGADGIFDNIKTFIEIWLDDNLDPEYGTMFMRYNIDTLSESSESFNTGCAVRFVRAATVDEQLLADGTACTDYVGNDGRSYGTVKIGTQVWLSENLAETLYSDLSPIPEVTDAGAWAALITGAMCYYDNDISYGVS